MPSTPAGIYAASLRHLSKASLIALAKAAFIDTPIYGSRQRIHALLVFKLGYLSTPLASLTALPDADLLALARKAALTLPTPPSSPRALIIPLMAHLADAEDCPHLHDLPTHSLRALLLRRGWNTGWRAPSTITRRDLLTILIASMSSPDAPIIARLADIPNARLLHLAADHGVAPRLRPARHTLVRDLTLALRHRGGAAALEAPGPAGRAQETEQARVARRYFVALRAMVDENVGADAVARWCRSDRRAAGLCRPSLARLRNFCAWTAARERTPPERSAVVTELPRKPRFLAGDTFHTSAAAEGVGLGQDDFALATEALHVAANHWVESETYAFAALRGMPWSGLCLTEETTVPGGYEDDVVLEDEECDDEFDAKFRGDEQVHFFKGVGGALANLPGGRHAPRAVLSTLLSELASIGTALAEIPENVDIIGAVGILRLGDKDGGRRPENSLPLLPRECLVRLRRSLMPDFGCAYRSQSRLESVLWNARTPRVSFQEIGGIDGRMHELVKDILEPQGLLRVPIVTRRLLISVYGSVEGIAEDLGELRDVEEVLGNDVRCAIVDSALALQRRLLLSAMKEPPRNADADTIATLIRKLRTAKQVKTSPWKTILTALAGDDKRAHEVCLQIHGRGITADVDGDGDADLHTVVLPWLLASKVGHAHWWAAKLNQRFAGITATAQACSLETLVSIPDGDDSVSVSVASIVATYDALHSAGRCDSVTARKQYAATSLVISLLRLRGKPGENVLVAARVMEKFERDAVHASQASDRALRQCIEAVGSAMHVWEVRDALVQCAAADV